MPSIPKSGVNPSDRRIIRNAATALAIAWSMRVIGLVSVVVLARMLTPRDFGIIALAMSAAALVDIFSALGLRQALLRIPDPERAHYDTVWTIQFLLLVFLAAVLVAIGPVAAWFYEEPALTAVITVLATRFIFFGLVNIGTIDFDRHLELGRDLRLRITVRVGTFVGTLIAAVLLHTYWALVIGAVLQSVLHAAGSYLVHPYRPRFCLAKRAELLGVSLWMFLTSAAHTIYREIERLIVGRIATMQLVGFYSVSKGLSSIFTEEIATALNRVTFVTIAQTGRPLSAEPERLSTMLGAYSLIIAPLGFGLAATAEDACRVLLGAQWTSAAPYLQLIAPAAALFAVYKLIISSLQASGEARRAAVLSMSGTLMLACAAAAAVLTGDDAIRLASAALAASVTLLLTGLVVLSYTAKAKIMSLLPAVARPFASALLMMMIVRELGGALGSGLGQLTICAIAGALIYAFMTGVLWFFSGCPAGAERLVAEIMKSNARRPLDRLRATRS